MVLFFFLIKKKVDNYYLCNQNKLIDQATHNINFAYREVKYATRLVANGSTWTWFLSVRLIITLRKIIATEVSFVHFSSGPIG